MTDFLDQLEDELRVAADRRGQPRRRRPRPTGALKFVAAAALVALVVIGIARLANGTDTERAAAPSPTATPGAGTKVAYATSGDPALLNLVSARLRGFIWTEIPAGPNTADASLGSVVLYRPGGEELAESIAFTTKTETRPLTPADEQLIDVDVSRADVVVVYGREVDERMLADPEVCAPAGGALKLCVDRSDGQRYSVFVLDGRPLSVEPVDERGWWNWAALSPDGQTILAQWHDDCPTVYLIPTQGDRRELGPGKALGWTTDGRAIVAGGCGADEHFLYSLDGSRVPWAGPKDRMEPSLHPLDLGG